MSNWNKIWAKICFTSKSNYGKKTRAFFDIIISCLLYMSNYKNVIRSNKVCVWGGGKGGAKKEKRKPCTPAILLWVIVRMVEREVATVSMFENIYFCWTDTDTFYDRKYAVTASTAMVATLHKPTHNGNWVSFVFFMHESFVYRCWYIFQKKIIRRAYTHTHSRQIFRIFEHLLYECLCVCEYCLRILLMCVYLYQKQNFSA